jgi:hypothetical protein
LKFLQIQFLFGMTILQQPTRHTEYHLAVCKDSEPNENTKGLRGTDRKRTEAMCANGWRHGLGDDSITLRKSEDFSIRSEQSR